MRSNSVLKAHNKNSQQYNTENFKLFCASCKMANIVAIKRTSHFGVRPALAPALNFGGMQMTALPPNIS